MNFQEIYQISIGIAALYLFFISWNFTVATLISFIVYKLLPFVLAVIITVNACINSGYIIKV